MVLISILLFSFSAFAIPCGPHEVYIREHKVSAYKKEDGTRVRAHIKKAHCRKLRRLNYFKDSTAKELKGIKTKIKKWNVDEKEILKLHLESLPTWLKKYKFSEVLRGTTGGHAQNPAAVIPFSKVLIVFDNFFARQNKTE